MLCFPRSRMLKYCRMSAPKNIARGSLLLIFFVTLALAAARAAEYTPQEINNARSELAAYQKELDRLTNKLANTDTAQLRSELTDKIKLAQFKIIGLKKIIAPPAAPAKKVEAGPAAAQPVPPAAGPARLSLSDIHRLKAAITGLQKDINGLNRRLKLTRAWQTRLDIVDKIDTETARIAAIKKLLYPKKKPAKPRPIAFFHQTSVEAIATIESFPEEVISSEAVKPERRIRIGFQPDVGFLAGFFAGANGIFGEVRVPVSKVVIGPARPALRLSAGYAQTTSADRRYVPVNLDLVLNFPPGWLSGVENYLGGGLNYTALTSGHKAGTVGGELFYGVQSDGFGGIVFGEIGYAALCSGAAPADLGMTVTVGFREPFGF
jgi:hypothetical protein